MEEIKVTLASVIRPQGRSSVAADCSRLTPLEGVW